MKKPTLFASGIGLACCLFAASFALAAPHQEQEKEKAEESTQWKKPPAPVAKIGVVQAMSAATKKIGGGTAFSAMYEYEDGAWSYGVLVVKGHKVDEVIVDASTGKVMDVESVSAADEAAEVRGDLERVIAAGG